MSEGAVTQIGDNLKRLCGMHAISQETLASHVGLSKQGLNNIVVGRSQPSLPTAQKLAEAFGIGVDDLAADTLTCIRAAAQSMDEAPIFAEEERRNASMVERVKAAKKR